MPSNTARPLVRTIPHGAIWSHFQVPIDESGTTQDILLTFPDDKLFETHSYPYFGHTIGRTSNRIANGKISNLNGKDYQVSLNENADGFENSLHGGHSGWGKKDWRGPDSTKRGLWDVGIKNIDGGDEKQGIVYTHTSPDGDEGFPGEIEAKTFYFEGRAVNGQVVLEIEYEARLTDDKVESTVIGMTNHAYFNLNGRNEGAASREEEWSLDKHTVSLATSSHLVLDANKPGIPNGETRPHPLVPEKHDTAFSLTGDDGRTLFIDDCFVLPEYKEDQASIRIDTRGQSLRTLATIKGERSGITLKIESTEPAFQFYTGKFIDVQPYEGGKGYGPFSGFCVEPSRFVDAAGREEWRKQVLLRKGEIYGARSRYTAWKE